MLETLRSIFDPTGFPPRWSCGTWTALHGWIHVIADLATWAAYYTIPALIAWFLSKRRDLPYTRLFWLFAAFILACGTGHLIEATIFWRPWYRLSALVKVVTAIVSWATVLALVPALPKALALPGLAATNARLEQALAQRQALLRILRTRNETLDQFSRIASHDLKAPLRAIENLASWIEDDSGERLGPDSRRHLSSLRERSRQLKGLLDDLLRYVRADCDGQGLETIDLALLARETLATLDVPEGARFDLSALDERAELGEVRCVRVALRQVLQNLFTNAIRHCDHPRPQVAVECELRAGELVIRVRDDGPGIPEAEEESIFAPFQTGSGARGGSGMGLAIVRRLVQGWGGRVSVRPQIGRGACFEFTLPLAPVEILGAAESPGALEDPAGALPSNAASLPPATRGRST